MGERRQGRKKNIGFKAPGVDPAHDIVFAVLDSLPRGGASDIIVRAVMEFLQNHAGESVAGSGKRQYIILKDTASYLSPAAPAAKKAETLLEPAGVEEPAQPEPPIPSFSPGEPALEESKEPEPENSAGFEQASTELDEDTILSLIMGFNANPN